MAVATQSGVPCKFTAGDTVIFTLTDTDHPASEWLLDFALTRDGTSLLTTRAVADGDDYTVTLTGANTLTIAPGPCQFVQVYTEQAGTAQRETGADTGVLMIAPNPLGTLTPSAMQVALTACNAAIATLVADPRVSVNFNGQSYTNQDIDKLFTARDRLQMEVNRELTALGLSRRGGARIIRFRFT